MKAREYLEDIRDYASEILTLSEAIEKMVRDQSPADASAVDYEKEKVQSSGAIVSASSFLPDFYERLQELKRRKDVLNIKRLEAGREIDKVKSSRLWTLLYCRYILNYDWLKIKDRLNCSERNVYFLHKKALDEFEKNCHFM